MVNRVVTCLLISFLFISLFILKEDDIVFMVYYGDSDVLFYLVFFLSEVLCYILYRYY